MRVHLSNLGCKLNQAELERLARQFAAAGHSIVGTLAEADLHVVNSCTVTHVAARDSRKVARRARRLDPEIKTVLTGCYVKASPQEAAALAGVDLVVPNENKEALVAEVERAFAADASVLGAEGPLDIPYPPLEFANTRSLVKVEDGCNMQCTFCIIPSTRGAQRSRPMEAVLSEVRELVDAGVKEIVVTGVQISSYRRQGKGLYDLVASILEQTEVPRLRLTSIAPWHFDQRLLGLFEGGRLCRHFHLSLQSGCDATLERMRRPYTTASFASLVETIRSHVPGVAVTTDVIVGFPGETEEEFLECLLFTEGVGFAKVHAFPYSPRPGTVAAAMPDQIAHPIRKERMGRMLSIAERAEQAFREAQLGTEVEILWERQRNGHWLGMSDNYIRVLSSERQHVNWLGSAILARTIDEGVEVELEAGSARLRDPNSRPLQTIHPPD
jgi:threonylcarbamoyladenosine tRNA methylthiotransferase MtaB